MRSMIIRLISLSVLFMGLLQGEYDPFKNHKDHRIENVSFSEGLPDSTVNGSVCTISGAYVDQVVDLAIAGNEPLTYSRTYSSLLSSGKFCIGWCDNHQERITVYSTIKDDQEAHGVSLTRSNGAIHSFYRLVTKNDKKMPGYLFDLECPKGLTNGPDQGGGRHHIKNTRVSFSKKDKKFTVTDGEGSVSTYKRIGEENGFDAFFQKSKQMVRGVSLRYLEDPKEHFISYEILLCNTKTEKKYGYLQFEADDKPEKARMVTVKANDGRQVKYHMLIDKIKVKGTDNILKRNMIAYLKKAEKAHAPTDTYEYQTNEKDDYKRICKKGRPKDRFLGIHYYRRGENDVGEKEKLKIKDKDDYRIDRVRTLTAPVGHGTHPHTTHTFVYNAHEHKNRYGEKEITSGETDVYDALRHKTTYEYNKRFRLSKIHKYTGDKQYQLFSTEKFSWGADGTPDEGNLMAKALFPNTNSHAYIAYNFEYDEKGNCYIKKLYGNLTGAQPDYFKVDKNLVPQHPTECEIRSSSYSQNTLNLLTSETDSNGTVTHYKYKEGTDQPQAKFIVYENRLQIREFYHYDDDNFLTKKVIDNGSSTDPMDMSHVTERKITDYKPGVTRPILAESIEEKYLDLVTRQEVLLNRIDLKYDGVGNITEKNTYNAHGALCFTELFDYDLHGNKIKEVNAIGETVVKEYDENDNLAHEEALGSGYYIQNTYDYSNRLSEQEEVHGIEKFSTRNKYNYLSQRISSIDTYGNETLYEYNDFGQIIKTTLPQVVNENGQLCTPVLLTSYDVGGFPCSMTDANGKTKTIKNTVRGKPYHILHPDGSEEKFIYKLDGQLSQKTARDGTKTIYEYDGKNRIKKESVYGREGQLLKAISRTYDGFHLRSETDAEGLQIRYEYDFAGRLTQTFKNDLLVQHFSYDPLGRISAVKDYFGQNPNDFRLTVKTYDFLNRLTEEKVLSADQKLLSRTAFSYDRFGNKEVVIEGDQITKTTYNSDSKPIKIENAEGNITHVSYNTAFKNEHGQFVLQTIATDPLGNRTIETYDTANRLVLSQKLASLGQLLSRQKIFYDLCGNKKRVVDESIINTIVDKQIITLFTYSADNQIESITEAAGTPEQKTTCYQYNHLGQKVAKVKPDGVIILFEYDPLGRLHAIKASNGSLHYIYSYNMRDQVTNVLDVLSETSTSRRYNALGQLEQETLGNGLTITQTCDLFDRPLSVTLPDQSKIEYVYNGSHLKEIHRLINNQKAYSHVNEEHTLLGQIKQSKQACKTDTLRYNYDKLGRCIDIQSKHFNQTIPKDGYDRSGNLLAYQSQQQKYQFTYDNLYQLKSEKGHTEHQYLYDSLENRRLKDDVLHDYNHLNQLLKKAAEQYFYDLNGNLIKKQIGNEVTQYNYDALDRLVAVTRNGIKTTYQYDAYHRRLSKKQSGRPDTLFLYQGQEEIGAWQNNSLVQLKVLNQSQRKSAAIELNHIPYIPLQDLFGNVVCLTDMQGEVVERYQYTAFGEKEIFDATNKKIVQSQVDNPWQYSNKRYDKESDLIAFGLRYYDPALGRWTAPDPAGFEDGANLYTYVHNNPLRYFDLLGLAAQAERQPFEGFLYLFNFVDNYLTKCLKNISCLFNGQKPDFSNIRSQPCSLNEINNPKTGTNYNHSETPGMITQFIGGILNSFSDYKDNMMHVGGLSDQNIQGIYSSSYGGVSDLFCYFTALVFGINYAPSQLLQKQWDEFFRNNPGDAMIHVICHSRGAVYVRNALRAYPPELRDRIVVTAVAPGAYIDKSLCRNVMHLVNDNDIVPWVDLAGRSRCRDTTVNLRSLPMDHGFTSDTYIRGIRTRMADFNRGYFK